MLLAGASFLNQAVLASDYTLLFYYIQNELNVNDHDISKMFLMAGALGLVLQGVAIQPLVQCMGEANVLVTTFLCGAVQNLVYGLAQSKRLIYVGMGEHAVRGVMTSHGDGMYKSTDAGQTSITYTCGNAAAAARLKGNRPPASAVPSGSRSNGSTAISGRARSGRNTSAIP